DRHGRVHELQGALDVEAAALGVLAGRGAPDGVVADRAIRERGGGGGVDVDRAGRPGEGGYLVVTQGRAGRREGAPPVEVDRPADVLRGVAVERAVLKGGGGSGRQRAPQ